MIVMVGFSGGNETAELTKIEGPDAMFKDANVTVIVSDMDWAVKFYVEILGLKLKSRYGDYFA
jgi:hypothetical protein